MGEHLGEAVAGAAIIFANVLVGLPLMVCAWYLDFNAPIGSSQKIFHRATTLFSCSVLLNSVWIVFWFLPDEWVRKILGWMNGPQSELGIMLIGFICLCASVFVGHGSRGAGKFVLRIGQYVLMLFSALCWIGVLTDM